MTPHYTQKRHKDGSVYRIPYYRCTKTLHFNNSVCQVKHINADTAEHPVVQKLSDLSQNEAFLKISVEELNGDLKRKTEPLEREAGQIKKRLEEIEGEIGRYVKALGQGKLSIERLEAEIGDWRQTNTCCSNNLMISSEESMNPLPGTITPKSLQRTLGTSGVLLVP